MPPARNTAHALALELGLWDVDGMLAAMTARQYRDWLEFFRQRNEREKEAAGGGREKAGGAKPGYGKSRAEQQRLSRDIIRKMRGYQERRKP